MMDERPIGSRDSSRPRLYRAAAVAAHRRGSSGPGRPLAWVSPATRWAVRVPALALLVALAFIALAPVSEYAAGPAMVRRGGRSVLSSTVQGTVEAIEVELGERVVAGQVVVRLDDHGQRLALDQAAADYEARLVARLRDPSDEAAAADLARASLARDRARAAVRARSFVAPVDGRVSDLRVGLGQALGLGDVVAIIEGETDEAVVVALLPGHVRPLLERADTPLSVEFAGFPGSRHAVELDTVADEIIGPAEAMRYLGREQQGAVELQGPLVIVEARLAGQTFESEGGRYQIYDGMQAELEAKLRSTTLLELLIPALREL